MAATSVLFPFLNILQENSIPWWTLLDPANLAQMQQQCQQNQQERNANATDNEQPCSSSQARDRCQRAAASASAAGSGPRPRRCQRQSQGQRFNLEEFLVNAGAIAQVMFEDFVTQQPGEEQVKTPESSTKVDAPAPIHTPKVESKTEVNLFQVKLDVSSYSPEELNVKTVDNVIIVEGKQNEKPDEDGFMSSSFTRKYTIPEGVKPETIACSFTADGFLIITAPIVSANSPATERSVPINFTGVPVQVVAPVGAGNDSNADTGKPLVKDIDL